MRRPHVLVVTLATLGGLSLGVPAAAGHPGATNGSLVLSGARSASATVRFSHAVAIDSSDMGAEIRGAYAGFFLVPPGGGHPLAGALDFPGFFGTRGSHGTVTQDGADNPMYDTRSIPAGRYRIVLVTDGWSRVTVPVEGVSGTVRIDPSTPVRASAKENDGSLGPGAPVEQSTTPVRVRPGTVGVMVAWSAGDDYQGGTFEACLTDQVDHQCLYAPSGAGSWAFVQTAGNTDPTWVSYAFGFGSFTDGAPRDRVPPGSYDAFYRMVDAGVSPSFRTYTVTADLG